MQRILIIGALCAVAALAQPAGDDALRSVMNRGVAAFKAAKYAEAVTDFQEAVRAEPGNVNAHLYLSTAYMVQWVPGMDSGANQDFAHQAEAEWHTVLNLDSSNVVAVASLASLTFNKGKAAVPPSAQRSQYFNDAEGWYKRLAQLDPNNKTAYYSLGVIQWERFYPELMAARRRLGMQPADPGPLSDGSLRADLRNRLGQSVEDGIVQLKRAIEIDPMYDEAMAYLNLLYRERADYSDTMADYHRDIDAADALVGQALEARKQKAIASGSSAGAPPLPPLPAPSGATRIRVGGNIQAANLVTKAVPVYPPLAIQARVQGTIRFSVIVDREGKVQNMQLVSGHPLLVPAASEAVKNYVYKPTLLNGQPVEVITQVDVNFTLSN